VTGVTTRVTLDRSRPEEAVFAYRVELEGDLTEAQRRQLLEASAEGAVRQALSRKISFKNEAAGAV
jgi:uncharacterized OsmC-like protein